MYGPDLSGVFTLAMIGLGAIFLTLLIGLPMLLWWIYNHVSIAW